MNIALAQLNYTIGDFSGNSTKIIETINKARTEGASIIVFSELAVCGYPPDDLLDYPHFIEKCKETLHKITEHTQNITAIVGCPIANNNAKGRKLYNAACVLQNGQLIKTIHKTLLPTYDVFDESRYFQSNDVFEIIDINGIKTAITICEDLWDEMDEFSYLTDPLKNLNALNPALLINISASPYNLGKRNTRMHILQNQCQGFNLPLIYVNQVGAHTDLIFDGNSVVLNGKGETVLQLPDFEECIAYYNTEKQYTPITVADDDKIETLHQALVFSIKDYFNKMGFTKAILGSSGGIDSALVQTLASKALGAQNVTAILMPSQFSSDGSVTDALQLSKNLGNPYQIIPIKNIFNSYEETLKPLFKDLPFNVAEENLQARSRAILLMAYSNKFGDILLNTSNKSEMSVGYTTLYGDMCGSLSVIGDVYKTDVYALCKLINKENEIIPNSIIYKAPSAELRPNQKDSDSLPEYDILDAILKQYIEGKKSKVDIIAQGFENEVVEHVINMVNRNEYKRFQAPPILRITSKSFGRGRVMPLVAIWKY